MFFYLWDTFSYLYTTQHILTIARYIVYTGFEDLAEKFLSNNTTQDIFNNSPFSARQEFASIWRNSPFSQIPSLDYIPYTELEPTITEEELLSIYNLIKDNEVDHLRELISSFRGIAHLKFDLF